MPSGQQPVVGPGSIAHAASKDVQFNLTEKGIDFLGYRTLRQILGSLGKSSFGNHDTPDLATGIEADGFSKPYEFGDTLNLDVSETLKSALTRTGHIWRTRWTSTMATSWCARPSIGPRAPRCSCSTPRTR